MYVIGIVGRAYYNKDDQEIVQTHDALRRMLMSRNDVVAITLLPTEEDSYLGMEQGKDVVNSAKLDHILEKCDAFVIPGGTYFYHFDEYVMEYAIKNDKPLLAICLGFQALCSMFAKDRDRFDMCSRLVNDFHMGKSNEYIHEVIITEGTRLKSILGNERINVNSVHHDFISCEMNELVVNAVAPDGVIEGIEYPGKRFVIGVQWHPEYIMDRNTTLLLDEFVNSIE